MLIITFLLTLVVICTGRKVQENAHLSLVLKELMLNYFHEKSCVGLVPENLKSSGISEIALMQSGLVTVATNEQNLGIINSLGCSGLLWTTNNMSKVLNSLVHQKQAMLVCEGIIAEELNLSIMENVLIVHFGSNNIITLYWNSHKTILENASQISGLNFKPRNSRIRRPK